MMVEVAVPAGEDGGGGERERARGAEQTSVSSEAQTVDRTSTIRGQLVHEDSRGYPSPMCCSLSSWTPSRSVCLVAEAGPNEDDGAGGPVESDLVGPAPPAELGR